MAGALRALGALLENDKKGIRKEAAWTISNITAGNPDQIEAVMQQVRALADRNLRHVSVERLASRFCTVEF